MKTTNSFATVALMLALTSHILAQGWTQTSAPTNAWRSVASSADGIRLVAVATAGSIYTSTDAGTNWTASLGTSNAWTSVASSADGIKLAACGGGSVYTSTDAGVSWISNSVPWTTGAHWAFVASSSDGNKLLVAVQNLGLFTSTNAGNTWISNTVPSGLSGSLWVSATSSPDGAKLWAVLGDNPGIMVSTNAGATWMFSNAHDQGWQGVAARVDGRRLTGVGYLWGIYTSTNGGINWSQSLGAANWQAIASSADGNRLMATQGSIHGGSYTTGFIYSSTNAGGNWTVTTAPMRNWTSLASSADGGRWVTVASGDGIYTWQSTTPPLITLADLSNTLALSWTIPSQQFGLEQSFDLATWITLTNTPALNLTNLQNQVLLAPSNHTDFFRLQGR